MTLPPAPFFADIADGPARGAAFWLTTADGRRIRLGVWPVAQARGLVLICPGRTEYIEKYSPTAQRLAAAGYASVALDWRGQGLSDRLISDKRLGHVADFADYQTDLNSLLAALPALDLPAPDLMIAHSMGGCIGLRALVGGLAVRAVMFSAPMWGIRMPAGTRAAAWALTMAGRHLGFDEKIAPGQSPESYLVQQPFGGNMLTNDPGVYADLRAQIALHPALALGGPTLRWLGAALREMRDLARRPAPRIPAICYLGSQEQIVCPSAIRTRMARWPNGILHEIRAVQHEILMDRPEVRQQAMTTTIAHFDTHCAPGAMLRV